MPRCKNCKNKFEPKQFNQKNCFENVDCINAEIYLKKKAQQKAWNKEKKERKERLKTREDYFQETLKAFNSYIRARDKGMPCISCDKPAGTYKLTSGHFYPQGTYRNIALDERNAHGQCWYNCNKNKSGNLHEYRPRLIKKIGLKTVEQLDFDAQNLVSKYSIPELKALKIKFNEKAKILNKNN
jgi:hypothetical protein